MIEAGTYIIDRSVINSLLGDDQSQINKSTLFFEFLKFNNKKAILTPKGYKDIEGEIKDNRILSEWVKIFIIDGTSIIGYSKTETEEQQLLLLADNIPVKNIFIVTEEYFNDEFNKKTSDRIVVFNLEKIFNRIWSDSTFREWVDLSYHKKLEDDVGNDNAKKVLEFIKENLNK